jgi:TorA maturation chaperone TorD
MTELIRALAAVAELPTGTSESLCALLDMKRAPTAVEFTEFFVFQQVPYASVYLAADGMVGGEPRDRIAGFWRALGCVPPAEADHLSTLLGAYADMCDRQDAEQHSERLQRWTRIRYAFLWEHLLSWLPIYLRKAQASAPEPLAEWAALLSAAIDAESRRCSWPDALPAHLREVPSLVDPREQPSEFVAALLSPARSGFILTRRDLAVAARALGGGGTIAGRSLLLSNLLEQEPAGTIEWLVSHAKASEEHLAPNADLGAIAEFWRTRAGASRTLLQGLEEEFAGGTGEGVK